MRTCAYCGRRLPWLHRVANGRRYCSKEHAQLHRKEEHELPASVFRPPQESTKAVETEPVIESSFEPVPEPDAAFPTGEFCAVAGGPITSESGTEAREQPQVEAPNPFEALRVALLAAASAGPQEQPGEPEVSAPLVAGSRESSSPQQQEWRGSVELFEAAEDTGPGAPAETGCDYSAAAPLLPLSVLTPAGGVPICCRTLPPRPPRRRIIVPSHPAWGAERRLPFGGLLTLAPRPAAPARAAVQAKPFEVTLAPVLLEQSRAARLEVPRVPGIGAPAPVQPALPVAVGPVPPSSALASSGRAPEGLPGVHNETPLPRPAPAVRDRGGLAPGGVRRWKPRPLPRLPELSGRGMPRVDFTAPMNGTPQPFRLHRLPPRPFSWRPEPAQARRLPAKLAPIPAMAPAGVLFIPRPAMLPARPAYVFGPEPGQTRTDAGAQAPPAGAMQAPGPPRVPGVDPGQLRRG